jgi:hypothetical protein
MERRNFLKTLGIGTVGAVGSAFIRKDVRAKEPIEQALFDEGLKTESETRLATDFAVGGYETDSYDTTVDINWAEEKDRKALADAVAERMVKQLKEAQEKEEADKENFTVDALGNAMYKGEYIRDIELKAARETYEEVKAKGKKPLPRKPRGLTVPEMGELAHLIMKV